MVKWVTKMANRYEQMNDFIRRIADILEQNPQANLDDVQMHSFIYSELTKLGSPNNKKVDFASPDNSVFDRLLSYFNGRRNLMCFRDPKWSYFLQFTNNDELVHGTDSIKIYIPQKSAYVERSARALFDFLDNANISHYSKLARTERFDDITVRVTNRVDAKKVLDFVSGNKQIQSGLIAPNPFAFQENNIALACDRDNSYNATMANILRAYFREKSIDRNYSSCNLDDFVYFTEKYYHHHFVNLNDIGEVVADFDLKGAENNTVDNNKRITTIGNILHLYLSGIKQGFTIDDYYRQFEIRANEGHILDLANSIGLKRYSNDNPNVEDYIGAIDSLLLDSVDLFKRKYNIDDKKALEIVEDYLDDRRVERITRDEDMRGRYVRSNIYSKLPRVLSISGNDLETYYYQKKNARAVKSLKDAVFETYSKYESRYEEGFAEKDGLAQASSAVFSYVTAGRADWFTRDNNARVNLINYSSKDVALKELERVNGNSIDIRNIDELYEACYTYAKEVVNSRRKEHSSSIRM